MKILFVCNDLTAHSGWSTYTITLAEELSARGLEVAAVVTERNSACAIEQYEGLPDPVKLMNSPKRIFQAKRTIESAIRAFEPDLVHFVVEPYLEVLPFIRGLKAKSVLTIHGSYAALPLSAGLVGKFAFTASIMKVDRIITVSNFTRSYFLKQFPRSATKLQKKTFTVHNGIALPEPQSIPSGVRQEHRILFVGWVKDRKGLHEGVLGLAKLRDRFGIEARYDIVGSYDGKDPYVLRIHELAEQHGVSHLVKLHGRITNEDLEKLYQSTSVFMMLSSDRGGRFEGFPLVFLEAAARGIPCLGPNTGGCPESINDKVSGFIVDPDDADQVADRLHRILANEEIDQQQCLRWAAEHSKGVFTDNVLMHYRALSK